MPSSRRVRKALLNVLPQDLATVYELGSGWGHLVFPLAKQCPDTRIIGYELSWMPFYVSKLLKYLFRLHNLVLFRRNFFDCSLKEADLVICYLFPGVMERLKEKFEEELRPRSVVISNTFAIPGWTAYQTIPIKGIWPTAIHIYQVRS